jgi:hypothetical protein
VNFTHSRSSLEGVVVKSSVLVVLAASAVLAAPVAAFAQKDGARPVTAPVVRPNGKSSRPTATPAAAPTAAAVPVAVPAAAPAAAAPAATGRYTWCTALVAPPLQRLISGVFLAPADTTINLTTGFAEAIKAKHHPNPQDILCDKNFPTLEAAEEARVRALPATIVWKMPAIPVDWIYVAP